MGTSADRTAGRGGAWTPLKHAASSYVRGVRVGAGSDALAERLLAHHVPVLGGAAAAAAAARAGTIGVQRLGTLLAGASDVGFADTLAGLGLSGLVGGTRFDVLDQLVTFIAGDGDELDSQAARDATCEVLDLLFAEADTFEELGEEFTAAVSREGVVEMLELFLSHYIYNKIPVLAERLGAITDPTAVQRADEQVRELIKGFVSLSLPEDPFTVDWAGAEGREIAANCFRTVYDTLEHLIDEAP
ncbi:hypothetical protein [Nocardia sputi]|uniref:hypothetical protein n=1 Tax=Nocardia sputi TaxID=2943705 RepID=UPI0020C0C6B6|nr:hypothetical protein [Nocardia sputi]